MGFKVGDKVVHPQHGVGEVTAVEVRDLGTQRKEVYVLGMLDSSLKVYVPVDMAERSGLRPVVSKKDADKVFDVLRDPRIAVTSQPWNRRHREYVEMLNSGSLFEVAKVVRDITRLKTAKELSFGEKQLLDKAKNRLVLELSLARRCKTDRVEAEMQGIFAS